ncbi:MAG TPA: lysylphosphatidylglycerol synthase transmembrane domain-containing protein [Gemmatimonadaceae bacterium]|nr:lysylphosphatidylglycerol synthase transmembrane domain-containing protein [Vicinamibacterales bacterium]
MSEPSAPAPSRARSIVVGVIKAGISIALLAVLLSRVDGARLWQYARHASPVWLTTALLLYFAMILVSAWRWGQLLGAQGVALPYRFLTASFLVATFFNNFLPSNIGGDVVRIADTARPAGSRTLATTVVLMDRGLGLLGLALMAALGASAGRFAPSAMGPVGPRALWAGFGAAAMVATPALMMPERVVRLLQPLRVFHRDWVDERLNRLTAALVGFREAPAALASCFAGAVLVQAILVGFYLAVAHSMHIPVGFAELAVIVPISFIVQMLPVSLNGFGVREATFGFYFSRLGLPLEAALLVSFVGAALVLLFSLSGGAVYLTRSVYRSA